MSNTKRIFTQTLLAAALATATAGVTAGNVTVTPGVGHYAFDTERAIEDDTHYSIGLGYQFDSPWSLELNYLEAETETEVGGIDVDQDQIRLDALYSFAREGNLQPYLAFGAGQNEIDAGVAGDDKESVVNGGGGFRYFFSDNVALRTDLRVINSLDNEMTDVAVTFGLNILLGSVGEKAPAMPTKPVVVDTDGDGVADSADQCSATPAGVAVDAVGCPLDSDNDGVADYKDQCPGTSAGAKVDEKGCYIMLKETREVTLKVRFANDSSVVPAEFYPEIEAVAKFMREFPLTKVEFGGYTDSAGSEAYNQKLSERRAKAVADVLMSEFNVDADRISSKGYGESNPVADNTTSEGRAQNRRVVASISATAEKKAMK